MISKYNDIPRHGPANQSLLSHLFTILALFIFALFLSFLTSCSTVLFCFYIVLCSLLNVFRCFFISQLDSFSLFLHFCMCSCVLFLRFSFKHISHGCFSTVWCVYKKKLQSCRATYCLVFS